MAQRDAAPGRRSLDCVVLGGGDEGSRAQGLKGSGVQGFRGSGAQLRKHRDILGGLLYWRQQVKIGAQWRIAE